MPLPLKVAQHSWPNRDYEKWSNLQEHSFKIQVRARAVRSRQIPGISRGTIKQLRDRSAALELRTFSKERFDHLHMPMVVLFTTIGRDISGISISILGQLGECFLAPHQTAVQFLVVGRNSRIDPHKQQGSLPNCANGGREFEVRRVFGRAFKSKRRTARTCINIPKKRYVWICLSHPCGIGHSRTTTQDIFCRPPCRGRVVVLGQLRTCAASCDVLRSPVRHANRIAQKSPRSELHDRFGERARSERQRTGALLDASRYPRVFKLREAFWSAAALRRCRCSRTTADLVSQLSICPRRILPFKHKQ
jgi:hypothetical protein